MLSVSAIVLESLFFFYYYCDVETIVFLHDIVLNRHMKARTFVCEGQQSMGIHFHLSDLGDVSDEMKEQ